MPVLNKVSSANSDRLFRDRELRDAYEAGAMKTSEVSGRDVALGGTGLALGAGSAYLGGAGGTALQQALSNRATRLQTFDTMGNVVQFDPKKLELLQNKLKKLEALNLKPSSQTVPRYLNLKDQLQSGIDSLLNSRNAQRYQSAADLTPGLARWGSRAGILAGGGLLAAAIAGAARRNSKTSSDNSTGLMVGGGLGALGAAGGSLYGSARLIDKVMQKAALKEKALEQAWSQIIFDHPDGGSGIPGDVLRFEVPGVNKIRAEAADAARKIARNFTIAGGLGTAAGLGVLGLGMHRFNKQNPFQKSKTSSDNSTGLMVGGGLGGLGVGGAALAKSILDVNRVKAEADASIRELSTSRTVQDLGNGFKIINFKPLLFEPGSSEYVLRNIKKRKILDEAAQATRRIIRNGSIVGGLGVGAGLGVLGLGLHRKFNRD